MIIDIAKVANFLDKLGFKLEFLFFKVPPYKGFDLRLPVKIKIVRRKK